MRSANGSISKMDKDRYRLRVEYPRDPKTGKRTRKTKVVRGSRKQAQAELNKMLLKAGQVEAASDSVTLDEFFEAVYMPKAERELREITTRRYRREYETYWSDLFGSMPLARLDPIAIETHIYTIETAPARLKAYKILRQVLNRAVRMKMLATNPMTAIDPPKVKGYEPHPLDVGETLLLLDHFQGHLVEPAVLVAVGGGLRRSEIVALNWSDVSPEGDVTVDDAITSVDGVAHRDEPKTRNSVRVVRLPGSIAERLNALRPPDDDPLVANLNGERMHPDRLTRLYTRHMKERPEGLPYISLKDLRHTSLTLTIDSGVDLLSVSLRAGYASTAITERFYLRPHKVIDERAADSLDAYLRGPKCP